MSGQKPREIAVRILQRRERGEDFVENIAEKELASANLSAQDRGLAIELAYGCVRRQRTLDFLIDRKTQGRQQKPVLQILLRLGLYQIFFLDRVPEHAAVHETVELAKRLGFAPQSGFINAILRAYIRESEVRSPGFSPQSAQPTQKLPTNPNAFPSPSPLMGEGRGEGDKQPNATFTRHPLLLELDRTDPAITHSHPDWLWQRWSQRYGPENARALLQLNNTPPPTYARANTLRGSVDDLTRAWQNEGVDFKARQFDWTPLVFELLNHPPLTTLPSFQKGLFYLQDPSTLLAPRELQARPGEVILDLCAAPGGKTTYIAQLTSNQSTILAEDVQPARLALVRENAIRLGAKIEIESTSPSSNLKSQISNLKFPSFDRILIDAPCSNTGVLRRRFDLRGRLKEIEIQRLAATQLSLLEQAARRLKPNGTILYSTCSLEPEENQSVIQKFLSTHPDFRLDLERELLPFRDHVDGAYIARLSRST